MPRHDESNCFQNILSSVRFLLISLTSALPDIEVQLNAQNYRLGDSIKAKCLGTANPPIDRFAWYIGNQLIEEQTGAELLMLKGAQRALNGELLRCQAFNEVGDSTADSLLNVECKCLRKKELIMPEPT